MISASQLLHKAMGSPKVEGLVPADGVCWVCGEDLSCGVLVKKWLGSSFTDFNRVASPTSEHVCEACTFLASRHSPVPGRPPKEGKDHGGNFRNYSHMLDADGYVNASKGEKPLILSWLKRPHRGPWFAAIADSGQIHTVPFCPVNPDGARRGVVLFERDIVRLPIGPGWDMVERIAGLLSAGATKDEVSTGQYGARAWDLCGPPLGLFEEQCGQRLRGSGWFSLALWLAQRDEEAVSARIEADKEKHGKAQRVRKGKAADANRGGAVVASKSVPPDAGEERPQELGHPHLEDEGSSGDHDESGGVVHGDATEPEDRKREPRQLGLFG